MKFSIDQIKFCWLYSKHKVDSQTPSFFCCLSFCSLSDKGITDQGACALSAALQVNQSLQELKWVQSFMFYFWWGVHWYFSDGYTHMETLYLNWHWSQGSIQQCSTILVVFAMVIYKHVTLYGVKFCHLSISIVALVAMWLFCTCASGLKG